MIISPVLSHLYISIKFLDAKVELLKFLTSYVTELGKKVNPYVLDIKVT